MKLNNSILSVFIIASSALLFVNCKKQQFDESVQSDFINVEEINSSAICHFSSTTSANSGGPGYDQFTDYIDLYDSTQVLMTFTEGNVGTANNDTIFDANSEAFGVLNTSTIQTNFSSTVAPAIALQNSKTVIANSNYELELTDTKILIKTTTKFFRETTGDYYLTPYIVIDSIVGDQTGHPDGASTNHRKVVTDVGRLKNYPVRYLGYQVASGVIDEGYQFNLSFEASRSATWTNPEHISIALILTKKDEFGNITFINANTNH